jgi:hypothetical protein
MVYDENLNTAVITHNFNVLLFTMPWLENVDPPKPVFLNLRKAAGPLTSSLYPTDFEGVQRASVSYSCSVT